MSYLIENFDKVVNILNTTLFSVLIDESTDISTKKILCKFIVC